MYKQLNYCLLYVYIQVIMMKMQRFNNLTLLRINKIKIIITLVPKPLKKVGFPFSASTKIYTPSFPVTDPFYSLRSL